MARRESKRTSDGTILAILTPEQHAKLDEAMNRLAGCRPRSKAALSRILLDDALAAADRILAGEK